MVVGWIGWFGWLGLVWGGVVAGVDFRLVQVCMMPRAVLPLQDLRTTKKIGGTSGTAGNAAEPSNREWSWITDFGWPPHVVPQATRGSAN